MDILVCNCCKAKYHGYHTIIDLTVSALKTVYKFVKLSIGKLVMISANYHDITQLLLVMIVNSKNCNTD